MKANEIDALVKLKMTRKDIYPVYDGIVKEKEYFQSKFKILWILKEPHDEEGGNWHMKDFIGNKENLMKYKNWKRTFNPIIYVTFSILNDFMVYDDMYNIPDKPEMIDVLRSIAFINLKKIPGETTSKHHVIKDAYEKYKDIILQQIETYNPEIIICGGTMGFIAKDLGLDGKLINQDSIKYFSTSDKIYIDALHPNQRGHQDDYCNGIINAAKVWADNKK